MPEKQGVLICVFGPTAVGKTELTIKLANKYKTEIISADSRQFYKEMSIGTAKPSKEELERALHHFINSHSISEEISAGQFEKECVSLLNKLFEKHQIVLMTGGSGLYIKAVTDGFSKMPSIPEGIRDELNNRLQNEGLDSLVAELKDIDPKYYKEVDKSNPQRVIRALEMFKATGKPFSSFRDQEVEQRSFKVIKIGLDRPREELYDRINRRVDMMISEGLVNEVEGLVGYRNKQALQTVGYKEVFEYFDGNYTEEKMVEMIKQNSRRYAKRQLTWFRKESGVKWFHPDEFEDIVKYIDKELS